MKQIGRYEIRKEAGRGGMSTVYEAFDPHFKRAVAVKVMTQELLDNETLIARFRQEAQIIAALEHPAIVPVYDFGEEEMRPFLVMRLMTGGTLAERLRNGPLSVAETAAILKRIGSALDRAHEQNIIHRDLKPSNIMFDQYGDAFLADFGIARLTEGAVTLTGENVIGTPAYMSPEQIHGDQTIDGRSDIYALGVICFEMLTGRRPFQETAPARLMMQHLIDPVPDIREVRPDLPAGVESVINQTMAKSPDERYTNAGAVSDTLDSLASISPEATAAAAAAAAEASAPEDTAAPLKKVDEAGGRQAEAEEQHASEAIDVTVPDSAELAAQRAADEALDAPPPPLEPAGDGKATGKGRSRNWIAGAAAALGILLIAMIAAGYFGGFFTSGDEQTAEGSDAQVVDVASETDAGRVEAGQETAVREEEADTAEPEIQPTIDAHMERFFASMDAEDYGAAEASINEVITLAPDEFWPHSEKAWLMDMTGDPQSALHELALAIELDPENGGLHSYRGSILRQMGDLETALEHHLLAVELTPDDPDSHMELAETYKETGDLDMALEQYNQALALKDDEAWYYSARADAYFMLSDYELGLADLERASELEPELRDFFTQAGDIFLYEMNDPERALEFYTRAVERTPDDGWVYSDRAAAYEALGNVDAALADREQAIARDPENSNFYIGRAQLFLNFLDNPDEALADLNRAVEVDPENPDAFGERAALFQYYAVDLEAALEDRSRALELEPDGPWRYTDRALVLREMGRDDEALADLSDCAQLDPQFPWCSWERAWLYDQLGQRPEAAADFQLFLELVPEEECPECQEDAQRYIDENG